MRTAYDLSTQEAYYKGYRAGWEHGDKCRAKPERVDLSQGHLEGCAGGVCEADCGCECHALELV